MKNRVKYNFSTYPSRFVGYQSKNKDKGIITLYISNIWKMSSQKSILGKDNTYYFEYEINEEKIIDKFVNNLIETILIERICLERGFQKIRMKNRCLPICKIFKYGLKMLEWCQNKW